VFKYGYDPWDETGFGEIGIRPYLFVKIKIESADTVKLGNAFFLLKIWVLKLLPRSTIQL
jgi:hypothetical protein